MNSLFIILSVIIILTFFYLIYRNNQYNKILESFDNSTQNSLSTFFQNTVDNNSLNNKNVYNGLNINKDDYNPSKVDWNGIWKDVNGQIYSQIINLNDKILIAFSRTDLQKLLENNDNISSLTCPLNTFIGLGNLNKEKNTFILYKIICNSFFTSIKENNLSGTIDKSNTNCTLNIYGYNMPLNLTKEVSLNDQSGNFYKNSLYLHKIAPYITNYPMMHPNKLKYKEFMCKNSSPCKVTNLGLGDAFDKSNINACGNPISVDNNTCRGTPKCLWYTPAPPGYTTCESSQQIYDYSNFAGINTMYNMNNTSLEICDHINLFNVFNSSILCYITNLGHVQTLNYEFFGTLKNENNLTMQEDLMGKLLNMDNGLLYKYKKLINKNNLNIDIKLKASSFTNCVELNDNSSTIEEISDKCLQTLKKIVSPSKDKNSDLHPCVWSINKNNSNSSINSCPITLATSSLYDTPVKYVEFNDNKTGSLSLYSGGNNQNVYLVNSKIVSIRESNIMMTCNIKTNNGLYLIPSLEKSGFSNNSSIINLEKKPEMNGKWLIIGFDLKKINDLNKILSSNIFSFGIIKRSIKSTWIYPKTISDWYTPISNNLIGNWNLTDIKNSANMTISFWINIKTNSSNWRNIFHVSNSNNDNLNIGDRVPAVWISPNRTTLYIRASSQNNRDDGLIVSSQLPLNNPIFITIVFNINKVEVYFSGVSVATYNFQTNIVSAKPTAKFYISDPWYSMNQNGFSIKSFELYNDVLNNYQIAELYNYTKYVDYEESGIV